MRMSDDISKPDRTKLKHAWLRFRNAYGNEIAACGWTRSEIMGGRDLEIAQTYNDIPDMIVLLGQGEKFVAVTRWWIQLSIMTLLKNGIWLDQDQFAGWRDRFEERAAIRQFCGGKSLEHAEYGAFAELLRAA